MKWKEIGLDKTRFRPPIYIKMLYHGSDRPQNMGPRSVQLCERVPPLVEHLLETTVSIGNGPSA